VQNGEKVTIKGDKIIICDGRNKDVASLTTLSQIVSDGRIDQGM
jgi:hypothetical protein